MESSVEATMNWSQVKAEMSEDSQLEPLLILEEGDEPSDLIHSRERGRTVLRVKKSEDDETGTITESRERSSHDHNNVQQRTSESEMTKVEETKVEGHKACENTTKMDERSSIETQEADEQTAVRSQKMPQHETQEPEETNTDVSTQDNAAAKVEVKIRHKDRLSPDDEHTVHRISPEFPDALCELLYTLQEGRRLNDQRCSFRLKHRRRCYSEPSTPHQSQRVVFSSMTSLQREEFFDLLVISQGRRLDDQRAELQNISSAPPPPQPKIKQRKSSCKVTEVSRKDATKPPKEDLYNMIVISQAQGRLEEQRSAAPGPMDDEDFFSLLLKVQGGRMDEQRTELKPVNS